MAADMDVPSVAADDFAGDPEAEAGTGFTLGGDEGLKDGGQQCSGNAGAGVGDGEAETGGAVGGILSGDTDAQAAAVAHGIDGVADDVGDDLAEFTGAGEDGGAGGIDLELNTDARCDEAGVVEDENGAQGAVNVRVEWGDWARDRSGGFVW